MLYIVMLGDKKKEIYKYGNKGIHKLVWRSQ